MEKVELRYWWEHSDEKNMNKLAFVDTYGIKSADLKDKLLFKSFTAFQTIDLLTNPALLNALAHDAKLVLSFTTPRKYRDPSDPLRSLITSRAPPSLL